MTVQITNLQSTKGRGRILLAALAFIAQAVFLLAADDVVAASSRGGTEPVWGPASMTISPDGSVSLSKGDACSRHLPTGDPSRIWENVFTDDFESGFPGTAWDVFNNSIETDTYWEDWTCWSGNSASHSVGCAAGGANAISCGQQIPFDMSTWMIHGPFTLADQGFSNANLQFSLNLVSEADYDYIFVGLSADNNNYMGQFFSGTIEEFMSLNLAEMGVDGNIFEAPELWIGFYFYSDEMVTTANGAQIDDVAVVAENITPNVPPTVTLTSPLGGETFTSGQTTTITYNASDPDSGPSDLEVAILLSLNNGDTWEPITEHQANTGSYQWTVPDVETTTAKVGVIVSDGEVQVSSASPNTFSIVNQTNVLSFNQAAGPSGSTVTVPFELTNDQAVKGLQLDVQYDAAIATFVGVTAVERGTGLNADGALMSPGRGRIIMYYDDVTVLQPGAGVIGQAIFSVQGPGSQQSNITPVQIILSGPASEDLAVTGNPGLVTVEAPTGVPVLQLSALKNPGRPYSLQLFVRVTSGSGNAPTLTVQGAAVALTQLSGSLFSGTYSAEPTATNIVFNATDTNINGAGTSQVTVSFP